TAIGMAGCFGYTSLDIGLFPTGAVASGTGSMALPIPTGTAFIGSQFATQGVSFSGATSLGLAGSNGMQLFLGL
ncbi:MAG: hypothetical protein KAI24_07835, partial [Planctomycetes bacterium]|nr:hypothetical protein [Planctomycetota bacterium]